MGRPEGEAGFRSDRAGRFLVSSGMGKSANSPGSAERRESEVRHHDRVSERKTEKPGGHFAVPLTPGSHRSVQSKSGEQRSHGFVEELPRGTPQDAHGYF